MTFGKDPRTYDMAARIVNEEIEHEAGLSSFLRMSGTANQYPQATSAVVSRAKRHTARTVDSTILSSRPKITQNKRKTGSKCASVAWVVFSRSLRAILVTELLGAAA